MILWHLAIGFCVANSLALILIELRGGSFQIVTDRMIFIFFWLTGIILTLLAHHGGFNDLV